MNKSHFVVYILVDKGNGIQQYEQITFFLTQVSLKLVNNILSKRQTKKKILQHIQSISKSTWTNQNLLHTSLFINHVWAAGCEISVSWSYFWLLLRLRFSLT
jgi:hypothetical protein